MKKEEIFDEEGLSTKFRPKSKFEMKYSDKLKITLTQLERELLAIGWDSEIPEKKVKYKEMRRFIKSLEGSEVVVIPNYKNNSFSSTIITKYMTVVDGHLGK